MSIAFEELEAAAMELPSHQRAELATRLFASLDPEDDDCTEEGWDAEILRRVAEMDAGTAEMIPAEQVFAELRAELRK